MSKLPSIQTLSLGQNNPQAMAQIPTAPQQPMMRFQNPMMMQGQFMPQQPGRLQSMFPQPYFNQQFMFQQPFNMGMMGYPMMNFGHGFNQGFGQPMFQ